MTHIDNSKRMSSEQIKETLTNLINKSAKKVASEGEFDRTILAKIQYCSDATLGQYKIQYQNGYYTAYALDKTRRYSNGASVYVTVPGNNLNNRLFIQDLATNDNSQKTYLTNLEGDQQYSVNGPNFISGVIDADGLNMSSHWDMPGGREVVYYEHRDGTELNPDDKLVLDETIIDNAIKTSDGFIRFGAEFRTDLEDDRKLQGNYGIRLVLVFDDYDSVNNVHSERKETYQLDTFSMYGAPFEFNDYSPRYNYWEIDKANFKRVDSITGFVTGFPHSDEDPAPIDIFVRNISINAALKLYDAVANDDYVVKVLSPKGTLFGLDDSVQELPFEAQLTVRGNEVTDAQKVEFYWAKKNSAIDSVGHPKYSEHFKKGWQCLNQSIITQTDSVDPSAESLQNYIINATDYPTTYQGILKWVDSKNIVLPRTLCKGRETYIQCCAVYENKEYYSREYLITNIGGYYVLLDSDNGTVFYNGKGQTTLTAGVFQTRVSGAGEAATYESVPAKQSVNNHNITYKWEITNNNVTYSIPISNSKESFYSQPDWGQAVPGDFEDNVDANDGTVDNYLRALSQQTGIDERLLQCCQERFNYYNNYANNFNGDPSDITYIRAKSRRDTIKTAWSGFLDTQYVQDYVNSMGLYILGPSDVSAHYTLTTEELKEFYDRQQDPRDYVQMDTPVRNYYSGRSFYDYEKNTLYDFKASEIVQQAKITVTALITQSGITEALETKEILLNNIEGSDLQYNLEIVNGDQVFMYSEGGIAPTVRNSDTDATVTIRPLSYRLYSQTGDLVFDSAGDNSELVVTQTHPKWSFYTNSTLLTYKYSADLTSQYRVDTEIADHAFLLNAAMFYYDIATEFNVNYKERSNVELSITYEGATYTASTNFTFAKQGNLGTNGTNMFLSIEDPAYEQYRSDILANDMYSTFIKHKSDYGNTYLRYSPNERHLKTTYMFATKIYSNSDGTVTEMPGFDDGDYCNLRFAHGATESNTVPATDDPMHFEVVGDIRTTLYGYWYEAGSKELVDSNSGWSTSSGDNKDIQDQTKLGRSRTYDRASFQLSAREGQNIGLTLIPPTGITEGANIYYKPMEVIHSENQKEYEWTANNVVQCAARHTVREQLDPDTQQPIVRKNYGYYQIPFFYYAHYTKIDGVYTNITPTGLDPARHFVITGGYDQVMYGADGLNPQYNKQEPFTIHLFDPDGNDITEEVLDSSGTSLFWNCSYGFRKSPIANSAPAYNSYTANVSLGGKYCTYNNKIYKCIVDHTPNEKVTIRNQADGTVVKVYNPNGTAPYDFITPYWEEVNSQTLKQSQKFTPPVSYEACATDSLFSSWISVKITYIKDNDKIEAAALLPINVICNMYGSEELNTWDGKKLQVEDGYLLSSKVAAGIKEDDNKFTGITIGRKMITNGTSDENEVGLFGYGHYYDGNEQNGYVGHGQTLFLDAKTGLAAFGPRGSTQIILNPKVPKEGTVEESWSRLAGWYFSPNYLYKPLWADDQYVSGDADSFELGNSSYYNTNPPDADGVSIPGSVGLYVPGSSLKSEELTPDTVFFWASAAGIKDLSFDDDGSLSALQDLVSSIKSMMNKSDFPLAYPITSKQKQIKTVTSNLFVLYNKTELAAVYTNVAAFRTLLDQYTSKWTTYINTVSADYPDAYNDVTAAVTTVRNVFLQQGFPTQTIDGVALQPICSDGIIIENKSALKKWYCDSNVPAVTAQTSLMTDLNSAISNYESKLQTLLNSMQSTSTIISELKSTLANIDSYLSDDTHVITQNRMDWNTDSPYKGVYNADKVTIENITELQEKYIRPAATASQKSKDYITSLNTKMTQYNTYHTNYLNWQAQYANSGQAVSYKDSNSKKQNATFFVTYGGRMHCTQADVEGKITAKSGMIGTGDHALEIAVNKYDSAMQKNQFYLLYNKAFRVKGSDADTSPSVYIDGTIMARSGQIGNANDGVDGSDNHTVFLEYSWYPRKLPDMHSRWGDKNTEGVNYRKPQWDTNQGKIVKYAMWHPCFSIIDNAGGAKNYAADGEHVDFTYKDGDVGFVGKMYASGGRIGDWIVDDDILRDPYQTIKFKPNILGRTHEKTGYILSGRTIFYGDGSVDGACQGDDPNSGLPISPMWTIDKDGVANFKSASNTFTGSVYTGSNSSGNSLTSAGLTASSGTISGLLKTSNLNVSESSTFKNLNCTGTITADNQISARGGILMGGTLSFGSGVTSIGASSATLPGGTDIQGSLTINGNLNGVTTLYCDDIRVGSQTLQAYIVNEIDRVLRGRQVTVSGTTREANGHKHGVTLSGTL